MCGIAGAYGQYTKESLLSMGNILSHRGPDNTGVLYDAFVGLVHTRLSIIDLSANSNQPLLENSGRVCIVFNGEIYNYKILRQNLVELGYSFSSEGDAEVILNLYLEYGLDCLSQLEGIFAFAIWDKLKEELFIARDQYGVKPLYYSQNQNGFYFASELKALLLQPSISTELNMNALFRSIVFLWSPGPETILKDIFKLDPGNYLIIKDKKIICQKSYAELPVYDPRKKSVSNVCQELQTALSMSVKEQLISDVPVGAFLSGGLDSSLIVALAKELGITLSCFTMDVGQSNDENEGFEPDLPFATRVAEYLNVPLNIIKTNVNIVYFLTKMIYFLDEPAADPAPINVLLIAKQARAQGIKVLFSGAGGDDLFTGYRRHLAVQYEKLWSWLPYKVRASLQKVSRTVKKKNLLVRRISKLFYYASLSSDERILSYFYWINPTVVRDLFTEEAKLSLIEQPMDFMLQNMKKHSKSNAIEKLLYLEKRYFLVDHNFNYTDKMAMAEGIEVRVPFLDKRVVDLAANIKTSLKQRYFQGKWILKKMAKLYLPKIVIYRKKTGFGAPLALWLKTDLQNLMNELLSEESIKKRNIFKADAIRTMIKKNDSGQEDYTYPIFALMCIELWCRIFIDNRMSLHKSLDILELVDADDRVEIM